MRPRRFALTFLVVHGLAVLAAAQTFTVLHSFTGGSNGGNPYASVIQDPSGNLYGVTGGGGDLDCEYGCGVVYELDTAGTETVLYTFCTETTNCADGALPIAPVARDEAGYIYGTTEAGGTGDCYGWGSGGCGTVFKIDTAGNETVLHSFTGWGGCAPFQGLVVGNSGTLFGTTFACGAYDDGTIFKVEGAAAENFVLLHAFGGRDGLYPQYGHLTMDKSGNLYGLRRL